MIKRKKEHIARPIKSDELAVGEFSLVEKSHAEKSKGRPRGSRVWKTDLALWIWNNSQPAIQSSQYKYTDVHPGVVWERETHFNSTGETYHPREIEGGSFTVPVVEGRAAVRRRNVRWYLPREMPARPRWFVSRDTRSDRQYTISRLAKLTFFFVVFSKEAVPFQQNQLVTALLCGEWFNWD